MESIQSTTPYTTCHVCVGLFRRAALEKLHCVDDAFRRQLESIQAAHQAELLGLANEKHQKIEEANQKVKCGQLSHKCFFLQSGRKKLVCLGMRKGNASVGLPPL